MDPAFMTRVIAGLPICQEDFHLAIRNQLNRAFHLRKCEQGREGGALDFTFSHKDRISL